MNNAIYKHIYNYPTLYKGRTEEESILLVLDHVFLAIGNGEDYTEIYSDGPEHNPLPDNYFDETYYTVDIDEEKWKKTTCLLKEPWYLTDDIEYETKRLIFNNDQNSDVMDFINKIGEPMAEGLKVYLGKAQAYTFDYKKTFLQIYPLEKHSLINEINNGVTFEGEIIEWDKITPSWKEGMLKIAQYGKRVYEESPETVFISDAKSWDSERKKAIEIFDQIITKIEDEKNSQ